MDSAALATAVADLNARVSRLFNLTGDKIQLSQKEVAH
jgi:hypothetical protein